MSSMLQSIQKQGSYFLSKSPSLPLSSTQPAPTAPATASDLKDQGMRRRVLSSLSLNIQPMIPRSTSSWGGAFRRSKSMSSMGEYAGSSIRKWWEWGWGWVMSRKPTFAADLEMNEEETSMLGSHSRGSWRHVFYKVRSEIRKLVGSDQVGLPQTFRYDSRNYAQNFDNGLKITS